MEKPDDPSVNVQMDLDISTLMNTISKDQLKGALIKLFSIVLHEVPELSNMVCIRGKLRQRLNNRIFIPTLIRDQRKIDLSGISIDNAYNLSLATIKKKVTNNIISNLRSGKNNEIKRAIRLFKITPSLLCKPIIQCLNFFIIHAIVH